MLNTQQIIIDCAKVIKENVSDKGCDLIIDNLDDCLIIKCDEFYRNRKITDNLVFENNMIIKILIIELKSNNAHPSEIEEKMRNGSQMALKIIERYDRNNSNM